MRAIAYLWLAETQTDPQQKRASYGEALAADPNNVEARQRLASLLTAQLPAVAHDRRSAPRRRSRSPPSSPQPQAGVNIADHVAHIIGGPNGPGTAFFVAQEGILATTRHVVGGLQQVTVELHIGRQLPGIVVRAYTDLDLTLIHVDHNPGSLLPITPMPRVADETPLTIVTYNGEIIKTTQRPTNRVMAAHWIPTTATKLLDAGGNPIFDDKNYLVGMMTKNTSRTSAHMFGVHISRDPAHGRYLSARSARRKPRLLPGLRQQQPRRRSGLLLLRAVWQRHAARAQTMQRYPIPQAEAYYETGRIRCIVCGSTAGIYNSVCLRCGQPQRQHKQHRYELRVKVVALLSTLLLLVTCNCQL